MAYGEEPDFEEEDETPLPVDEKVGPTGSITITINMDQYLSSGSLEDKIATSIANAVSVNIQKSIEKKALALVEARIEAEFTETAATKVQQVFDMPIQKYNEWGSKTGEPVVLRDMIIKRMDEWLKETVRKTDGVPGSAGYNEDKSKYLSRLHWMVQELAIKPLNVAVQDQVKTVTAEVKGMVQNSVSAYIADQLAPKMPAVPQLQSGQ
jgi:hypothetical protein